MPEKSFVPRDAVQGVGEFINRGLTVILTGEKGNVVEEMVVVKHL